MTATVYYDANSVALDSRLVILQIHSNIEFNTSHTSQQVHVLSISIAFISISRLR